MNESEADREAEREQLAVVDRIEDGRHAVLLVGDDELERVVPLAGLPAGAGAGSWLRVRFDGETLVAAVVDEEQTRRARQRVRDKMQQLRARGRRPRPPE